MPTARIFVWLSVASGLLGCRNPTSVATDDPRPPTSDYGRSDAPAEPPAPGPLNFEQVITLIEAELGAVVNSAGSRSLGYKEGGWREVVVFRVHGEAYCRAITPEAKWADCETYAPAPEAFPWGAQEYLGLAVIAYTDPAAPRVAHLRMLERSCQVWRNHICAEGPGTGGAASHGASGLTKINVERLAVSDFDGDMEPEIELVTTYVELGTDVESDFEYDPTLEIFARRRLTVLRVDLSRQLDIDIHQVMFEWIPGVYADSDVVNESYQLTPDGATVSWCEIDTSAAFDARECWEQACASPTTRVRFPYDADKDLYTKALPEALRPVVADWDGCRK